MARKFVKFEEAARILGVTTDELNSLRDQGEVHAYRDGQSWKFSTDDLERVKAERKDSGKKSADEPDSILFSEQELGESADSTSSTIIGKSGKATPAADSDLKLADASEPGGSDISLGSDLGLGSDITADKKSGKSDLGDNFDDLGEIDLGLDDELSLDEGSKAKHAGKVDSALDLTGDDDDLVLGGAGSDVTLGTGDSGISLAEPSDSGLSLEQPLELGGSAVEAFELGEDDAVSLEEPSDSEAPTQLKADDDFLLTPMEDAEADETDSGSQVIALDEDEPFGADATIGATAGSASAMLEPEFGAESGGLESGTSVGLGPAAAVAPSAPEAPYSIWNVLSLFVCVSVLMLTGMLMYDLVRNMWSWEQAYSVNSGLMNEIVGWFDGKKK